MLLVLLTPPKVLYFPNYPIQCIDVQQFNSIHSKHRIFPLLSNQMFRRKQTKRNKTNMLRTQKLMNGNSLYWRFAYLTTLGFVFVFSCSSTILSTFHTDFLYACDALLSWKIWTRCQWKPIHTIDDRFFAPCLLLRLRRRIKRHWLRTIFNCCIWVNMKIYVRKQLVRW